MGAADDDKDKKKPLPKGKAAAPAAPKGSQPLDAKAPIIGFASTPERGAVVIDLEEAYSQRAKTFKRGVMLVRGSNPYVVIQDEMHIKSASSPDWVMHTRAEVTPEGSKATLKSGASTMTMTVVSPPGATIVTEDVPDPPDQQIGSFKGIKVIKIPLKDVKGDQTVTVTFSQTGQAPATVVPLEQWVPAKKK